MVWRPVSSLDYEVRFSICICSDLSVFLILYPIEADAQADIGREDEGRSILSCQSWQGLGAYLPITPVILWFYVQFFWKMYTFLCLYFSLVLEEILCLCKC